MKTSGSEERVPLGKIVGVHGLKGELKIYLYASGEEVADTVESLKSSRETVFIDGLPYVLKGLKRHKAVMLVKFEGVSRCEDAKVFVGKDVFVVKRALPDLGKDEYYAFEIQDMEVSSLDGRDLGKVVNIFSTGSNDVYVVEGPLGEILIPAIKDVIVKIDVPGKKMIVRLIEGLLEACPERPERSRRNPPEADEGKGE
ncbi:MAG: ribosome maturation factor RimM [Deltaproteobacteria bacterium]